MESEDERNVARRVESQGAVVESGDDEQLPGRDSSLPGVVQGGSELFAMSDHEETPQGVLDALEQDLLETEGPGLWVADGWCWSDSRPEARHDEMSEAEEEAVVPGVLRTHNDESPQEMSIPSGSRFQCLADETESISLASIGGVGGD